MSEPKTLDGLRRAVAYGLENSRTNVIADLAVLRELFEQRDQLLATCSALLVLSPPSFDEAKILMSDVASLTEAQQREQLAVAQRYSESAKVVTDAVALVERLGAS